VNKGDISMNTIEGITKTIPVSDEPGLFESDTYSSPARKFSLLAKLFTWNRLVFYGRFFKIIFHGAKMARTNRYTRQHWFNLSRNLMKLTEDQGVRIHVTGLDNVRKHDGPVVYVSNHMSMMETVAFPCLLLKKNDLCIVLKQQLADLPIFGTLVTGFRSIAVSRDKPMEDYKKIIRQGTAALKEGYSVLIFPQSTRTVNFNPEEFNTVGVKLARKAGVPVVPVALKTDCWKPGRFVKYLGPFDREIPVHLKFGEPRPIKSRNGKEENDVIIEFIQKNLKEWRA
jgi:1-acyl-sn-glycerol-3-phosphate acyltransferase